MIHASTASSARQPQPGMPPPLDLAAVKVKQQAAWSSGDYSVVGTTLQIVGEALCEVVDLRSGERVLDVACGNGNAALAAARRFAQVPQSAIPQETAKRRRTESSPPWPA